MKPFRIPSNLLPASRRLQRRQARTFSPETLEARVLLSSDPMVIRDPRGTPDGASSEILYSFDDPAPSSRKAGRIVTYDPTNEVQQRVKRKDATAAREKIEVLDYQLQQLGLGGVGEFVEGYLDTGLSLNSPSGELVAATDDGVVIDPTYVFGSDQRSLVPDTTAYPHRAIGRIWMNFGGNEYSCSGALVSPFHVLTAGHCMHEGNGGSWADSIVFSAGQNGSSVDSGFRRSDFQPYGEAVATEFTTYTGWTQNGNWDWDIGLLTLDRNVGDHVGWLGFGWNSDNSFYSSSNSATSGYPGDLTPNDYDQWEQNAGNATSYGVTTHLLRSNTMDIWPGQSGSSHWYGGDSNPISHGVVSHQASSGGVPVYNATARITETKFNDFISWRDDDTAPTDRPDLVDWDQWFNQSNSSMNKSSVQIGDSFSATAIVRNNGTAATGSYNVSFYASTNTTITTGDNFIGSVSMSSLNEFDWNAATLNLGSFPNIPTGTYYIGWIIDSGDSVTEFVEGNNTGYVKGQTLTVQTTTAPMAFVDANNDGQFNAGDIALNNGELADGIFSTKSTEGGYTSVISGAGLVIPDGSGSISAGTVNLLADGNIVVGENLTSTNSHVTVKSLNRSIEIESSSTLSSVKNVLLTAKRDVSVHGLVQATSKTKSQVRIKATRDVDLFQGDVYAERKVDVQASNNLFAQSASIASCARNGQVRLIAKSGLINATSVDARAGKKVQIQSNKSSVTTTNATIAISSLGTNSSSIRVKAKTTLISDGASYFAPSLSKISRLFASESGTPSLNAGTLACPY